MGRPDQLLKYMLEVEAPQVTAQAATFRRAPEIATTELTPDGLLSTETPERLPGLPAPWPLLVREAVVDGKMPGDHLDPLAFERCLWRREARQVQRLETEKDAVKEPWPAYCAAWIVAPHLPEWIGEWGRLGYLEPKTVAPGCTLIHPSLFPILWVAANELPLHEALIPFLLARSGPKLKEFVRWVVHVREPEWFARVVRSLPEVAAMLPEFKPDLSPDDQRRVIEGLKQSLQAYPEAGADILAEGVEKGTAHGLAPLVHLFSRRLGRDLSDVERRVLAERLNAVGADRLGDVVLDLEPGELNGWLADPKAQ
jgi:hypothetical protein